MRLRKRLTLEEDRARSIAEIRATFAWFGMPLDDLTDDQVEEGVLNSARLLASCGVKAEDAAKALRQLVLAM